MWSGIALELLSRDEEVALARAWRRSGDAKLEDRLVRSQLRLSAHMARAYRVGEDEREDLIQQGSLGVVEAVRRFDPERGIRLASYAGWWIRAFQLRYLLANHRLVRLGSTQQQRKIFFNLRSTRARLSVAGVEPAPEQLAAALGVSTEETVETARRIDYKDVSLDGAVADDRPSFGSRLASSEEDAESRLERGELIGLVRGEAELMRGELEGRERALFDARFCEDAPTLAELGKRFGVSRERARQLEARLLGRLKTRVQRRLAA